MNWYLSVLKNYATFSGRARRAEYWMFFLFHFLAAVVLSFIDGLMGSIDSDSGLGAMAAIYILLTFIPNLAVTVRRLHDTNRSGWWLLLYLVPLIGPITILIFTFLDGTASTNDYGDNPKAIAE